MFSSKFNKSHPNRIMQFALSAYFCIHGQLLSTHRNMKKLYLIMLSLFSGLLLSLAWPERGFPGLLFAGLVPMLILEDQIASNRDRFIRFSLLFYVYPGFLLWNVLTTWWIVHSTVQGGILANTLNALFMSIVFQAFHWTKKKLRSPLAGYAALIAYWVAFEHLHLTWDLNWPWLNLGNGFSEYYRWVQWYEFTGTFGGTVWVLVGNILLFLLLNKFKPPFNIRNSKFIIRYSVVPLLWILVPIIASFIIYHNYKEEPRPVNFVVVQPNTDPYSEQFTLPPQTVVGRIMSLAGPLLSDSTDFVVAPESAIQDDMWENDHRTFYTVSLLKKEMEKYPHLNFIIGGSTFYAFGPGDKLPRAARKFTDVDKYYNAYNTAILVNGWDTMQLYHKSKLTPGVEIMPSLGWFNWIEKYAIDLGGTVGSLGTDSIQRVYHAVYAPRVAPIICYESIFGGFYSKFVRNGAQVMVIITNDGWWGNTAGHRQHFSFAHLRAIETRRSIARSANTGISALIDQRGDVLQKAGYWEPAALKGSLNANSKMTFYVNHGDYIARILTWLAGALFLASLLTSLRNRFNKFKR
jgi:apolipoprotein N-acyltransferase